MAEEKDDLDAGSSADGKSVGRIFAGGAENDPSVNLEAEIEKNIRIRTMPRKFKISTAGGDKKTTVIGAVIMIVGLLVLASAVYLAYMFLINPQKKTPAPAVNNSPVVEQEKPAAKPTTPVVASPKPTTSSSTVPVVATSTPDVVPPIVVATSTPSAATSTTPTVATSAPAVAGAPLGAKAVTELSSPEKALFGADPLKVDSDGDGFSDLSEVLGLYNPTGTGKITDNQHVGVYQNAQGKYSVYYLKNWKTQNLENGDLLMFTAADNSLIQIISQPNTDKQSIKSWYNNQFTDTPATDANVYSHDGWQGIFQQDKEIFYLADNSGNRIYTISYVPAANNDVSFYNIFLMMINSFTVK